MAGVYMRAELPTGRALNSSKEKTEMIPGCGKDCKYEKNGESDEI
jgi:hypothetical protein